MLPVGLCAQTACVWEATARKPGNVHRYQDFDDLTYVDLVLSAAAVGPELESASRRRVGETVLEAIRATRRVVATNTNLGTVLLLAPLASVPGSGELRTGVIRVLEGLDVEDARAAYRAIRLANPGGLGHVAEQDVREEPTQTLWHVMSLAAERDLVARQYVNGFREVFDEGVPALELTLRDTGGLETAIVGCHLLLMARHPDSLIARKCGVAEAEEARARARQVVEKGWPHPPEGPRALAEFDAWLREKGRARNPGTTADLVAASLFAALRGGSIPLPCPHPWTVAGRPHD